MKRAKHGIIAPTWTHSCQRSRRPSPLILRTQRCGFELTDRTQPAEADGSYAAEGMRALCWHCSGWLEGSEPESPPQLSGPFHNYLSG
jgi:hypothetical protein